MCFGGGGGTNTVVQTPNVPAPVLGGLDTLINRASSVTSAPYQAPPSPESQVAPLNPDQTSSFDAVRGLQGQYQPYIGAATDLANRGAAPIQPTLGGFDSAALQKYGNPFLGQVEGAVNQQIDRQKQIAGQGIAAQAASAGAFGGDRAAIASQEADRNAEFGRTQALAGLEKENFSQAQNQFNVEQNRGLAARESDAANSFTGAGQMQGIAGSNLALGIQGAGALQGVGGVEQQQQQNVNNASLANFYDARNFPYQQLSAFQSAVQGTPYNAFGQTTTSPSPSPISQVAGLGIAGATGYGIYRNLASGLPSSGATNPGISTVGGLGGNSAVMPGIADPGLAGSIADNGANAASGADAAFGGVARGGMVRPRASYARGGIAGIPRYDDGGAVTNDQRSDYYNPQADLADELGIAGSFADRQRAAMAGGSSRSYGAPWLDGINIPVRDPRYPAPAPASSADATVNAHDAAFPDYQGPPAPPLDPRYPTPAPASGPGAIVDAHEAMSPEQMGPQEPASATTERLMRLAANGDKTALAILYPDATPPGGGPAMAPVSTNPSGQVMPLARGESLPDLRGTAEAEAITSGKTPEQVAAERMTAQMPPAPPYAPTDLAGAPQEGSSQGIGSASAATVNAVAEPAPGLDAAKTPAEMNGPAPAAAPMPGIAQPITPQAKPSRGDLVIDGGKRFVPGGAATRSVLPGGVAAAPVTIDGQAVQAPAAGQGISVAAVKANARDAQDPRVAARGIPEWAMPLMTAGFAMMGGTSPFPLVNIGQGAQKGMETYEKQRLINATTQLKTAEFARKTAHDEATHQYQLARVAGTNDRTAAMLEWHQEQIQSNNELRRQGQISTDQWRQSLSQHQQAIEQLSREAHDQTAAHQRATEDQAVQNRLDMASKARSEFYRERVGQVSPLGTASPEQQQQIRREMDELHPLPTRDGKPAPRSWNPLPMPTTAAGALDAAKLVPNTVYTGKDGKLGLWNGRNIEPLQ